MPQPRVFVIGDSISMDYGPHLERMLGGTIRYARKTGREKPLGDPGDPNGANGGDSSMVVAYLEAMRAGGEPKTDWLVVNCGLHDIKVDPHTETRQVPPAAYARNLERIADLAEQIDARLAWVRTTPVDDERHNRLQQAFRRHNADVMAYNAAADEILRRRGAPILDLYGFTDALPGEVYRDHVHFRPEGCALQGAFLAGALRALAGA